jgi:hypothetical protein
VLTINFDEAEFNRMREESETLEAIKLSEFEANNPQVLVKGLIEKPK